jgi:hypothetical protein
MKLYFHVPGNELVDGLVFLHNDVGCVKMVKSMLVALQMYLLSIMHGEEDSADSGIGSDFEDEYVNFLDKDLLVPS